MGFAVSGIEPVGEMSNHEFNILYLSVIKIKREKKGGNSNSP